MIERLPYEEHLNEQWNDLPLPDVNMAWADMKRRLEEDDDRPILPFWLRGCAGWGLLAILLLGVGWWLLRPEKWFNKNRQQSFIEEKNNNKPIVVSGNPVTFLNDSAKSEKSDSVQNRKGNNEDMVTDDIVNGKGRLVIADTAGSRSSIEVSGKEKDIRGKKNPTPVPHKISDKIITNEKKEKLNDKDETDKESRLMDTATIIAIDSLKTVKEDSITQIKKNEKEEAVSKPKSDTTKKGSFSFSAGIAMQQQLPVSGQSLVPFNALGRKGSLRDYIPSIYVRLNRDDKWFVQSGFRYGAPQLVNELLYNSRTDSVSPQKINTTTTYLKKTYYHQLPLTFNYFVLPNWSLGTGVVWNKFSSAVSSRDITQQDRFTLADTVISSGAIIRSSKDDTTFTKSFFQATFETQYKWKRLSIGANYSFGLQPYIKFSLPGGMPQEQKNASLQLFIRYELWKSKKK